MFRSMYGDCKIGIFPKTHFAIDYIINVLSEISLKNGSFFRQSFVAFVSKTRVSYGNRTKLHVPIEERNGHKI